MVKLEMENPPRPTTVWKVGKGEKVLALVEM